MDRRDFVKKAGVYVPAAIGFPYVAKSVPPHHSVVAKKNVAGFTLEDSHEAGTSGRAIGDGTTACTAGVVKVNSSYTITRFGVRLNKLNSPTGTITAYLYDAATSGDHDAPDDRLSTCTATLDISTLTASYDWYYFDLTTPFAATSGKSYSIVLYSDASNGSAYARAEWNAFIGSNAYELWNRGSGPPAATNDSGFWGQQDPNGSLNHRLYS